MRGDDQQQGSMFSYLSPEDRVPSDHPLRPIRAMTNTVLKELSSRFDRLYARMGRPSIAPEKLLRALLLQVFYSIRSERLLMEQLDYNLLFRWFVGLNMDDPVWDATVFSKNRDRLLAGEVAQAFFEQVLNLARHHGLMSEEHFSVDGTLVEAWAGQKSFQPKDPPDEHNYPPGEFRGQRRSNATHQSTTDPEARLYKKGKGQEAKLCYLGHVLMENKHSLVRHSRLTPATGKAEREAAVEMVALIPGRHRLSLGADKAFDTQDFVTEIRELNVIPHVAQNTSGRRSAIDGRTTRHPGYLVSQKKRQGIEKIFGWLKTVGLMRKARHRGVQRLSWMFILATAAYNLIRIRNLITCPEVT